MAGDIYYPDVVLSLAMSGANNSTTFTDTSLLQNTVTPSGNAKISTTQSKYGGSSAYFDGTGDYLTVSNTGGLFDPPGYFTFECDVYITSTDATNIKAIFATRAVGTSAGIQLSIGAGASSHVVSLYGWASGAVVLNITTTTTIANNEWHHIAVVESGSAWEIFIDGVSSATGTPSSAIGAGHTSALICKDPTQTTRDFAGYIDNLRITKNVARYAAGFTPPAAEFLNYAGQLTGGVTEGSYSYISKWLVKSWKSFSASVYKEQVVTGATYTVDLPTLDPYTLACTPYVDGKWEADKEVALGEFYVTSNPETSAHLWEVTTAGTFAATEATWNLSGTTTQGTATLTYVGVLPNPSILGPKIPS